MTNSQEKAQNKIDEFSSSIREEFAKIGQEVKDQLVNDFDKILFDDLESLKGILQDLVAKKTNEILNQSMNELGQIIQKEFGGSIFGSIINDAVIPTVFDKIGFGSSSSAIPRFGKSSGGEMSQIGKSLARSSSRNG